MPRIFLRWSWIACFLPVLLLGCGLGQKGPALTDAEGTLTLDGKPLAGVTVSFIPDASLGQVPGSAGRTDAAGHFVLTAADGRPGAVVGKHMVTVRGERADERSGTAGTDKLVPAAYTQTGAGNPLGTVEVVAGKKTYDLGLKSR